MFQNIVEVYKQENASYIIYLYLYLPFYYLIHKCV